MNDQAFNDQRDTRADVAIGAKCRTDRGRKSFVALVDLSPAGCLVFSRILQFSVGDKVRLQPEGMSPVPGTIRWVAGSLAGVQFDNLMYEPVVEHLVHSHPWRPSESARCALDPGSDMPPAVRDELTRMLDRAGAVFRERERSDSTLSARKPCKITIVI
jgi:hypothetical protein